MDNDPPPTQVVSKPDANLLRWLLPIMVILVVVMTIVWGKRPKPVEVYTPPPVPAKTVAEVQQEIKTVQSNSHIPQSQKARILGFLQGDLAKAKANQ